MKKTIATLSALMLVIILIIMVITVITLLIYSSSIRKDIPANIFQAAQIQSQLNEYEIDYSSIEFVQEDDLYEIYNLYQGNAVKYMLLLWKPTGTISYVADQNGLCFGMVDGYSVLFLPEEWQEQIFLPWPDECQDQTSFG